MILYASSGEDTEQTLNNNSSNSNAVLWAR